MQLHHRRSHHRRYRVQVYQMRASARREETAAYTLSIAVTGAR
jgi:hypothetical protein